MSLRGFSQCRGCRGGGMAIIYCALLLLGSFVVPSVDAVKFQLDAKHELQRSAERYRQYIQHDSLRHLQQQQQMGDTKSESAEQTVIEEVTTREEEKKEEVKAEPELDFSFMDDPYKMGVRIENWDEKRASWLNRNPHWKTPPGGKPRVLLVTGSQPAPCLSSVGDNFHLKALKNKMDYARIHNWQIYNSLSFLDPMLTGVWSKLPVARTLMVRHPEIEWIMWMDSDAVFTDMMFEIPFDTYEGYNLVMWAWEYGVKKRDWVAVNDGVFFLRNCQWSIDLFDKWSPMGKTGTVKTDAGVMLSTYLTNRLPNFPADDQSALMYVMLTDKEVMDKTKLIDNVYLIHGYWVDIVERYEDIMEKFHPGLGDCRWPFTTHFTGCSPCSGANNPDYPYEMCMANFNRAFNFADNQVLAYFGYRHETLASHEVVSIWNASTTGPLDYPALLGISPWEKRITEAASKPQPRCCGARIGC